MFRRILILSASAGNGHVKAAEAMEVAFRQLAPDAEIRNIDVFKPEYSTRAVGRLYGEGYIKLANKAPTALGIMYDRTDRPWGEHGRKVGFRKLKKFITEFQPDLVVSTHFIPSEVVSHLLCTGKINAVSAIVVTDFDAHAMWFSRHYDHYFVALGETREYLRKHGIITDRVHVTGIPINPIFAVAKDKREMRVKYGLDLDRPTILLSAGGFGVGPMQDILAALGEVSHPVQVLALCGKNAELKAKIEDMAQSSPATLKLVPIGYTDKMDEYMSAADIVLGKPGGLTTSEGLAKRLAFVIVNPIPGQEERNSDHLLEEGVAMRSNELSTLAYKLNQLLGTPERVSSMQANAARLSHPGSAREIASILLAGQTQHEGITCVVNPRCCVKQS